MAYENVKLVISAMSGEIYMARILKNGTMGDSRKVATQDCLRASAEWFMTNGKKMASYGEASDGVHPHLFFTADPDRALRINEILNE